MTEKSEVLLYVNEERAISLEQILDEVNKSLKSRPHIPEDAEILVSFVPFRLLFVARWEEETH